MHSGLMQHLDALDGASCYLTVKPSLSDTSDSAGNRFVFKDEKCNFKTLEPGFLMQIKKCYDSQNKANMWSTLEFHLWKVDWNFSGKGGVGSAFI